MKSSNSEAPCGSIWRNFEARQPVREDGYGQTIFSGVCAICKKRFKNHRSFYHHSKLCCADSGNTSLADYFSLSKNDEAERSSSCRVTDIVQEEEKLLSDADRAIVIAVCRLGIPLQTTGKEEWKQLLEAVGATKKTPCPQKLRGLIIALAANFRERIRRELKGKHVTVIADGGTLGDRTVYATAYFCEQRVYFGGLLTVSSSDHKSLAEALAPPIGELLKTNVLVVGIITDNAKNLVLATTSTAQDPKLASTQNASIQSLLKTDILHIQCGIHTTNLVIADYCRNSEDFCTFKKEITELFKHLRSKQVKLKLKNRGVSAKVPMIQEIKWLTYVEAFSFLQRYEGEINAVLAEDTKSAFTSIKETWKAYLTVLDPLGKFLNYLQRNNAYLADYYEHYHKMIRELEALSSPQANELRQLLRLRIEDSGLLTLAELSFIFLRRNVKSVSSKYELLFSWSLEAVNHPRRHELQQCYERMIKRLTEICVFWRVNSAEEIIPVMFDIHLKEHQVAGESGEFFFRKLMTKNLTINHKVISWQGFCLVAWRLAQLPASEAIAERMFSHLSSLFPSQRWGSTDQLLQDQMMIRMQTIFDAFNETGRS